MSQIQYIYTQSEAEAIAQRREHAAYQRGWAHCACAYSLVVIVTLATFALYKEALLRGWL